MVCLDVAGAGRRWGGCGLGVPPRLMVCRCSPRSSRGALVDVVEVLTAAALRQGWLVRRNPGRCEAARMSVQAGRALCCVHWGWSRW